MTTISRLQARARRLYYESMRYQMLGIPFDALQVHAQEYWEAKARRQLLLDHIEEYEDG